MAKTKPKHPGRPTRAVAVLLSDYSAVLATSEGIPLPFVRLFTAMRALWENASPEQRLEAMRRISTLSPTTSRHDPRRQEAPLLFR
jgi:hypothetical protein